MKRSFHRVQTKLPSVVPGMESRLQPAWLAHHQGALNTAAGMCRWLFSPAEAGTPYEGTGIFTLLQIL